MKKRELSETAGNPAICRRLVGSTYIDGKAATAINESQHASIDNPELTIPHRSLVNLAALIDLAMARAAPTIPVDAKMYRHFAIATVLITGCLAMFASGENREAIQNKIEAHQRQAEAQKAEQEAAKSKGIGKKKNFTDKRKVKGSFSSDSDVMTHTARNAALKNGGYAIANEAELVAGDEVKFTDSRSVSVGPGENDPVFTGPPPTGMSPEQYARMMEEAKKKKKKPAARQKMSNSELNDLVEASNARSQTRRN